MRKPRYESPIIKSERFPLRLAHEQDRVPAGEAAEWQALDFHEAATIACLDLGGVVVRLRGREPAVCVEIRSTWSAFVADGSTDVALDLSIRGVERLPFETPVAFAATSERDRRILVKLRGVCAQFAPDSRRGAALVERRSPLQDMTNLLRFSLMAAAPAHGRYLVRAAAVETSAGLALLIGPAQAGKSTAARLAAPRAVQTDDAVLVSIDGERAWARTVGLWGSEGSDGLTPTRTPSSTPIAAIVTLVKAAHNDVRALGRARASLEIACVTALLSKEASVRTEALAFADALAARATTLELAFSDRDGSFWERLEEAVAAPGT